MALLDTIYGLQQEKYSNELIDGKGRRNICVRQLVLK